MLAVTISFLFELKQIDFERTNRFHKKNSEARNHEIVWFAFNESKLHRNTSVTFNGLNNQNENTHPFWYWNFQINTSWDPV